MHHETPHRCWQEASLRDPDGRSKGKFHELGDKEVCQVETSPAKTPLIVTTKDKNGQNLEKFYARSGNSSQEMTMGEMNAYIKEHFR
jgi:hypothetical protein